MAKVVDSQCSGCKEMIPLPDGQAIITEDKFSSEKLQRSSEEVADGCDML